MAKQIQQGSDTMAYFVRRIQALESGNMDDKEFKVQMCHQMWIVQSLQELSTDPKVRTATETLLSMLRNDHASPPAIRVACKEMLATFNIAAVETRETKTIIWWTSLTAIASTLFAILIGNQGLIPFLKSMQGQTAPSGVAPSPNDQFTSYDSVFFIISLLHVFAISLFLILRFTPFGNLPKPKTARPENVEKTLLQFMKGWTAIWLTWAILYAYFVTVLELLKLGVVVNLSSDIFWSVGDVLNLLSAIAFFFLFFILDMPSVSTRDNPKRDGDFRVSMSITVALSIVVLTLAILGRFDMFGLRLAGPAILSFYVAISMTYFFARLDSHYLKVKRWMLAPLYSYAVIQVSWPIFGLLSGGTDFGSLIFGAAFFLKIYLFVVVVHWLQSGKLEAYINKASEQYFNPD